MSALNLLPSGQSKPGTSVGPRCLLRSAIALLALAVPALAQSQTAQQTDVENSQQLLRYLVACALPAGEDIELTITGQTQSFAGELGLAANWASQAMSAEERRRVSSCLMARTNVLRRQVAIELQPAADYYAATRGDSEVEAPMLALPAFEGGYFGDLFATPPRRYACWAEGAPDMHQRLEDLGRVCALPEQADGRFSRCGFELVGACSNTAFQRDGTNYLATAFLVFLPDAKPASGSTSVFP